MILQMILINEEFDEKKEKDDFSDCEKIMISSQNEQTFKILVNNSQEFHKAIYILIIGSFANNKRSMKLPFCNMESLDTYE